MGTVMLKCKECDRALAWQVPGEDYSICSSDYREDLLEIGWCYSCLIDHCCQGNRMKKSMVEWTKTKKHYKIDKIS